MPVKKAGAKKGGKKGGEKGGKKGKKSKDTGPALPETGPLFVEGTVDPMKGGKIKATRLGRTYELSVPPGAVSETCVIALRVRDFDGNNPPDFRFDGRIVSNKVEVSTEPRSLEFDIPAILRVPHFCADPDGESEMFVACLEAQDTRIVAEMSEDGDESGTQKQLEDEQGWKKLPGGSFNVGIGFAAVETSRLGIFYVCSNIADGIDSAVTTYDMKLPPGEFNAVAFDWVPGTVNLWTRTSLDRPVGPDGPVYLRRKRRVKIDFEAKRITDKGLIDGYATYEATFAIPDSRTDLYTGLPINNNEQGKEGANPAHEGAFDALLYEVMVVPEASAKLLDGAHHKLQQAVEEEKAAEVQAVAGGRHLDLAERKLYWDRILAARALLNEIHELYLPWSERRKALPDPAPVAPPKSAQPPEELAAKPHSDPPPPDHPEGEAGEEGEGGEGEESGGGAEEKEGAGAVQSALPVAGPGPDSEGPSIKPFDPAPAPQGGEGQEEAGQARQQYKDLPVWTGANRLLRFGVRMIPSPGFQEQHLMTEVSVLMADPAGEDHRLLQIPEAPGKGGKVRKVWVGPPKDKVHTFMPVLTRASFAELIVHVQLGAWGKKIVITISSGNYTLQDVREIVATHCFGRDLSEARFVINDGSEVEVSREGSVRAQTLRPSVGLWGNARRKGRYSQTVLLSYTPDARDLVLQIYDNLKMRGFPVWMDRECGGAKGSAGLGEAGLFVAVLTGGYQREARAAEEYAAADAKGLPKLHLWPGRFLPHGWLKAALKEPDKYSTHDLPDALSTLTAQQLDHVAIAVSKAYPPRAAAPPVIFYNRLPAPNAAPPPVSAAEWARLNPPALVLPEPAKAPKKEKKKEKKSPASPAASASPANKKK